MKAVPQCSLQAAPHSIQRIQPPLLTHNRSLRKLTENTIFLVYESGVPLYTLKVAPLSTLPPMLTQQLVACSPQFSHTVWR